MSRPKKIVLWIGGGLLGLIVVALIAGIVIVRTDWFRNMVRDRRKMDGTALDTVTDGRVKVFKTTARGTDVILHLRDGEEDFLKTWKLKSIISKYSDHISLPILMRKENWIAEKAESELLDEWETVNKAAALWTRAKS